MTDKYEKLRNSLISIPCIKWTARRATVTIPETEEWAGKAISITGLDKRYARCLARYIADSNPAVIKNLIDERDALLAALIDAVDQLDELKGWAQICSLTDQRWQDTPEALQPYIDRANAAIAKAMEHKL